MRFVTSLDPRGPADADEAWARRHLLVGEDALWVQLSGPDRRHAVGVARRVVAALGSRADRPVVAAALLHDVGKLDAGLGTFARVGATLVGQARGHERATSGGGRVARYLAHDRIGAELLEAAGSDPLTVAWARQHHLTSARWTVDPVIGAALKAADDD
jgi:predicted HD phosphohydrolase